MIFVIYKKSIVQNLILHEIQKQNENVIKESTFNYIVFQGNSYEYCDWGDHITEGITSYHNDIRTVFPKFSLSQCSIWKSKRYIYLNNRDFRKELKKFHKKYNIKSTHTGNNTGSIYMSISDKSISTCILKRLEELYGNINDIDFDDISSCMNRLLDYNYIKQMKKESIYGDGYFYDITEKGKKVVETVDDVILMDKWTKLVWYAGILFVLIEKIIPLLLNQ